MLQEKVLSNIIENCYSTIDELPIYNWNKIYETLDLSYLIKDKSKKVKQNILVKLWEDLQNEYLKEFGLEPMFVQRLNLIKQKAIKNYDYIITGDRFILTELSIIDADLKRLEGTNKQSFWKIKEIAENNKGFRIDPKTTTVIEWYHILKNLKENGKANKGQGNNTRESLS
jgi:hypothetical protein